MNRHTCDFLVIGSGIAGLCFAIHASKYGSVALITKKQDSESNTNYAQGGIACVLDSHDSFQRHIADTLTSGRGLSDPEAVQILVEEGPARIRELVEWGVAFSPAARADNPLGLDLGKEGGHSFSRIVHARDLTGKAVEETLLHLIRGNPQITLYEHHFAVELLTNHHLRASKGPAIRCYGAYVLDTVANAIFSVQSRITCLATGGAGQVYPHTTNPLIATGDGFAMAYRAGAVLENMEFIQFHPTTLYHSQGSSFLISEALRGYGAVLRNRAGADFMKKFDPLGSLAPRDTVARAIDSEMKHSGEPCVFLDIRHAPPSRTKKHFPTIYKRCRELGIDITRDLIPVVPAAHYICGGVKVDTVGNTSIADLYACGEVSCTGVHGANRLASNSLLEALVFSRRAAFDAGGKLRKRPLLSAGAVPDWDDSGTIDNEEWILLSHNTLEIQSTMWDYVGIVR
ncbi:MAG: L-aspartate oxidase, partial [Chitinispirillaceae bacterium]|nr:L-aspartate oxidase [Chitinispirillaceae bacterium]